MSDPASSSTPSSTPKHHEHQPPPRRRRPHESHLSSLIRWLQLKNYQYEVTFSLYMLTSTEKCIFNLVVFVLVSMLVAAAAMYLPDHVSIMYRRIWYYVQGEVAGMAKSAGGEIGAGVVTAVGAVADTGRELG